MSVHRALVAVSLLLAALFSGAPAHAARADVTKPHLAYAYVTPGAPDTSDGPAEVTVRTRLTDDLSGVESASFSLMSSSISQPERFPQYASSSLQLVSGTRLDGLWEGTAILPQHSAVGTWSLNLHATDRVSNYLSADNGGAPASVAVTGNEDLLGPTGVLRTVVHPSSGAATQSVTLLAAVQDEKSGVDPQVSSWAALSVLKPDSPGGNPEHISLADPAWTQVSGDESGGVWRTSTSVPAGSKVLGATSSLRDRAGNTRYVGRDAGPSESCYGTAPSSLTDVRLSHSLIRTDVADAVVDLDFRLTGLSSGNKPSVHANTMMATTGWFSRTADISLVSGDEQDGRWRARFTFAQYSPSASLALQLHWSTASGHVSAGGCVLRDAGLPWHIALNPYVPAAPRDALSVVDHERLDIQWTAPETDGGAPITGYEITAEPGGHRLTVDRKTRSVALLGLVNDTRYALAVRAVNEAGVGPSAAHVLGSTTPSAHPQPPSGVAVVPRAGSARLTWAAGEALTAAEVLGYVLRVDERQPVRLPARAFESVISGLSNDVSHRILLQAENTAGLSEPVAASVTPSDGLFEQPSAPQDLRSTALDGGVVARWTPPVDDGGGVRAYELDAGGSVSTVSGDRRSATVTGLPPGQPQDVRVRAVTDAGSGPWSATRTVVPTSVTASPTGVVAAAGPGSAEVRWSAPTGNAPAGYMVTASPGGMRASSVGTAVRVAGLTNGETYTFTVEAVNEAGLSARSAASNSVVPGADTASPALQSFAIAPSTLDTTDGAAVTVVTVRTTDFSGVRAPHLSLNHTSGQTAGFGPMDLASGDAQDGVWRRTVTVPKEAATGEWRVSLYPLEDTLGNRGGFGPPSGYDSRVTVLKRTPPIAPGDSTNAPPAAAHVVPSVRVAPFIVKFGQTANVTITGTPGATVDLYIRKYLGSFIKIRDGLRLDSTGRVTVATRPDMNLRFMAKDRTVTEGSGIGGTSGLMTVEKQVSLNVKRVGVRRFTFTGSINPAHPRAVVNLYRNGRLLKAGIPVNSTRVYSFTTTLPAGTYNFRVTSPTTGYNNVSHSPTRSVRIY